MAFVISPSLTKIRVAAGEPMVFSYQPQSAAGVPEDMTNRAFVFAVWDSASKAEVDYFDAVIVIGADGSKSALWAIPGTASLSYFGKSLKFEIAERESAGHNQLAIGTIEVSESAPRIDSLDSAPAATYLTSIVRLNDPATIDLPKFVVSIAAFKTISAAVVVSLQNADFSRPANAAYSLLV